MTTVTPTAIQAPRSATPNRRGSVTAAAAGTRRASRVVKMSGAKSWPRINARPMPGKSCSPRTWKNNAASPATPRSATTHGSAPSGNMRTTRTSPSRASESPAEAGSDHEDHAGDNVKLEADASGPICVRHDDVVYGSDGCDGCGAEEDARADQPPRARSEKADARADVQASPEEVLPGIGRRGNQGDTWHECREQADARQQRAQDRKAACDEEEAVILRLGRRAVVTHLAPRAVIARLRHRAGASGGPG